MPQPSSGENFKMLGALTTAIIGAIAGIITYIFMRTSYIGISDSIYIKMAPNEIFVYLKNPNNLPEYHYK